jgi:hypothetical protein
VKYIVKTSDGELTYGSIHELRAGFDQGLVEADDQVREERSEIWRKAGAIPELRAFAATKKQGGHFWVGVVGLVCLSSALALLFGHNSLSTLQRVLVSACLMIPVLGMSQRAFTKSIKRERK